MQILHIIKTLWILPIACVALSSSMSSSNKFVTNRMCPFAQKAWIALEVSGSAYKLEEISLYGPNGKPDWFWKLNPSGTVPVLVISDGNNVLADSDLILDGIDAISECSTLLYPAGKKMEQIDSFRQSLASFLPVGRKAVLGGDKKEMWDKLQSLDRLVVGPYVCGDDVTVADCAGFPFIWRIENEFGPLQHHGCDKLDKWLQVCKANKSFSKTVQDSWWWWW